MHTPQITFPQEIPPFQSRIKNARVVLETSWYIMVANPKQMATSIFSAGRWLDSQDCDDAYCVLFQKNNLRIDGFFFKKGEGTGLGGRGGVAKENIDQVAEAAATTTL